MHAMPPAEQPRRVPSPVARELKRHLLTFVGLVVALDAAAIVLYYGFRVRDRPVKTQQTFVAAWLVATLIVVMTMMKRIRQTRRRRL
jgi:hypothetical protein